MKLLLNVLSALSLTLAAHSAFAGSAKSSKNAITVAEEAGQFKTLLAALDIAGLTETVRTTPNLTIFAPNDEAFARVPAKALNDLLANPEALKDVLLYHVVGAKVPAKVAITLLEAEMLNGKKVNISFTAPSLLQINDSLVIAADIDAGNAIIHVIDHVLLPPTK
jgi:uncharacterized surface protein with fasciclin (FAS1) repeats